MATTEEWDVFYTNVMPILGVCVSTLGVALGFLALLRSQSQTAGVAGREPVHTSPTLGIAIPQVRYHDGQVMAELRNPGEWHDIRDFVQPTNPAVIRMVREIAYG